MKLSHLDEQGAARMVDVGGKPVTERTAEAEGAVRMSEEAFELVAGQRGGKGGRADGSPGCGDHGRQASRRVDPVLPPAGTRPVAVASGSTPRSRVCGCGRLPA